MDPHYAIPSVLLFAAGPALMALSGRLTGRRPSSSRLVTIAERAILLLAVFALLGGVVLIMFALSGAHSGWDGSSPV
jgi:hypothetical protein